MIKTKKVYKVAHYFSTDVDKHSIFVETDIDIDSFIKIIGTIQFKFEDLVGPSESMDEKHLLNVLVKFYGIKDVTKECQKFLPKTRLRDEEWKLVNKFTLKDEQKVSRNITIIQIDWYRAREFCCGPDYKNLMKTYLPDKPEFEDEIKNLGNFYPCIKIGG